MDHKKFNLDLSCKKEFKPLLKYNHNQISLTPNYTGQQYKQILFNNIFIKVDIESNSFIMTISSVTVKYCTYCIVNIVQNERGETKLIFY